MMTNRTCHICGCIAATGVPCHWVEWDLCSACRDQGLPELIAEVDAHEGVGPCVCPVSIDHEHGQCTECGGFLPLDPVPGTVRICLPVPVRIR
jgi:hypothetical protein